MAQLAPSAAAKQANARSSAKPTIQAAAPAAQRKQVVASRAQAAQATQAARASVERKSVQMSRSSPGWWDWLFGESEVADE
jgi:hypothetical protein